MIGKFVISGGPSTGKTEVINELGKKFKVFHEAARGILKNKRYNQKTQYEIFKKQLKQAREAENSEEIVFFDRGIPDALAYFEYNNFKIPKDVLENSKLKKTKYKKIFFLDFVPYKNDEIRRESKEEAQKIHKLIYDTYADFGYEIIRVPFMSVEKRAKFIEDFL